MKMKTTLAGLILIIGIVVGAILLRKSPNNESLKTRTETQPKPSLSAAVSSSSSNTPVAEIAKELPLSQIASVEKSSLSANRPIQTVPSGAANASSSSNASKQSWKDPEAREALKLVGIDPDAEQTWLEAINNPDIPANERKNLIEDLNEDGLSNPKNPGVKDLPLIKKRLELIERLLPSAMDQVNVEAFKEAQKDLIKMFDELSM